MRKSLVAVEYPPPKLLSCKWRPACPQRAEEQGLSAWAVLLRQRLLAAGLV
jgi:hypothetical protein